MSITFLDQNEFTSQNPEATPLFSPEDSPSLDVNQELSIHQKHALNVNCIQIAHHISACPICSKFYKCDKRGNNIMIIILAIVVLILMKKILKL